MLRRAGPPTRPWRSRRRPWRRPTFLFPTEPYAFARTDIDAFLDAYDCPPEKALAVDGEYCSWYGSRAIAGLRYLMDLAANVRRRG